MKMFIYNVVDTSSTASGSTLTKTLNIGSDADFRIDEIKAAAYNGTTKLNKVRLLIKESSGNLFSVTGFDIAFLAGAMDKGLQLREPIIVPKNTQLEIQAVNNSGSTMDSFEVAFVGAKLDA